MQRLRELIRPKSGLILPAMSTPTAPTVDEAGAHFRAVLNTALRRRGWSRNRLAGEWKAAYPDAPSVVQVYRLAKGPTLPNLSHLVQLAELFEIPPRVLVHRGREAPRIPKRSPA